MEPVTSVSFVMTSSATSLTVTTRGSYLDRSQVIMTSLITAYTHSGEARRGGVGSGAFLAAAVWGGQYLLGEGQEVCLFHLKLLNSIVVDYVFLLPVRTRLTQLLITFQGSAVFIQTQCSIVYSIITFVVRYTSSASMDEC